MKTPTEIEQIQLQQIERAAEDQLAVDAGRVEAEIEASTAAAAAAHSEALPIRGLIGVALTTIAAGLMLGGIFHAGGVPEDPTTGILPRAIAIAAGLIGVALAGAVSRVRQPATAIALAAIGIFLTGIVLLAMTGPGNVLNVRGEVEEAVRTGHILRPPTNFLPGWLAITGWISSAVGFGAAWILIAARRPALAVMGPLVLAAFAGISIPQGAQIPSGIAVIVLFVMALGVVSGSQTTSEGERLPAAYELRRALRSLPLFAIVIAALVVIGQTNFLFPRQLIDPAEQPQKPHPVSLSSVQDRDLFDVVDSTVTGPFPLGHLDVWDGQEWLLPPYSDSEKSFRSIPASGIVDPTLQRGAKATFVIKGLTGAVLPGLPDTVGIAASGPKLVYDVRGGNIRLVEGEVTTGFSYTVAAAGPPNVDRVISLGANPPVPPSLRQFTQVQPPPPAVVDLIRQAPKDSKWKEFDWLRNWVLQNVVSSGSGNPVAIPNDRVQAILTQKEGSPYEIVAVQALLARWIGLPSRIGYGFDGGRNINGHLEVHPDNGASWPEVWFSGFEWVPVVGVPQHAKAAEDNAHKQTNPGVVASQDIGVPLYVPTLVSSEGPLYEQLRPFGLALLAAAILVGLLYLFIPLTIKLLRRQRRRAEARRHGPRAELALAYTEWRDHASDFGYDHRSDTPLQFTTRFVSDNEHTEFAWLVTRALWGDLQGSITPELAARAREFSSRLATRLSQAHPITVRVVALFSRRSLRAPYAMAEPRPAAHVLRSA